MKTEHIVRVNWPLNYVIDFPDYASAIDHVENGENPEAFEISDIHDEQVITMEEALVRKDQRRVEAILIDPLEETIMPLPMFSSDNDSFCNAISSAIAGPEYPPCIFTPVRISPFDLLYVRWSIDGPIN